MSESFPLLEFHHDAGHGWIKVSRKDFQLTGCDIAEVSKYSYQSRDGEQLFLEEDCDADYFINKLMKKFKLKYKNHNEWPRKMEPIYADWHGNIRSMEPIR